MEIKQKVALHNEFTIEVVNKDTGEVKQTGKAYNMILDNMYNRLCNFQDYFNYIAFGSGTYTFTDSSSGGANNAIYKFGSASKSSTQYKFGSQSCSFSSNGYLGIPDSASWNFGTGDFTIDFWVRYNNVSGTIGYCGQVNGSSSFWGISGGSTSMSFQASGVSLISFSSLPAFTTNTWYHIAFVRTGNTLKLFINGTQQGGDKTLSATMPDVSALLNVGKAYNSSLSNFYYVDGYMDEFRISNNARWTSGFTPSSSAYVDDINTLLLLHFEDTTITSGVKMLGLTETLGIKAPSDITLQKDIGNNDIYWTRRIQLMPEEYIGSTITEVGISYQSTASPVYDYGGLITYALIKDSEGNPIAITKTDTDVINIYATVYVSLNMSYDNMIWIGNYSGVNNSLINYLVGHTTTNITSHYFYVSNGYTEGVSLHDKTYNGNGYLARSAITWIADPTNKKITSSKQRLDVNTGNGNILEIGVGSTDINGMLHMYMPATPYSGHNVTNETIGTGNGSNNEFIISKNYVRNGSVVATVNGSTPTSTKVDYWGQLKDPYLLNYDTTYAYDCAGISRNEKFLAYTPLSSSILKIFKKDKTFNTYVNYTTNDNIGGGGLFDFSSTGDYLVYGQNYSSSTNNVPFNHQYYYLLKYNESTNTYNPIDNAFDVMIGEPTNPSSYRTYAHYQPSYSPDDNYLGIVRVDTGHTLGDNNSGTLCSIYQNNGESFTKLYEDTSLNYSSGGYPVKGTWTPNNSHFVYGLYCPQTNDVIRVAKKSGATFVNSTPVPSLIPDSIGDIKFSPDGNYLAICGDHTDPSRYLMLYTRSGDTFSLSSTPLPSDNYDQIRWSSDGTWLLATRNFGTSFAYIDIYNHNNGVLTYSRSESNSEVGTINNIDMTENFLYISAGSSNKIYSIKPNKTKVLFDTPPANGEIVKADYSVDYIPKNTFYVLDLQFSIQFGEGV